MSEERRAVSVVKGLRQGSLFPRAVVRGLTRSRRAQIEARLEKEKAMGNAVGNAVAYLSEAEKQKSVTILEIEETGTACRDCGSTGVVYAAHCWREEYRPILALCRPCAEKRAGGNERVHVRPDRPRAQATWKTGRRPEATDRQRETLAAARKQQAASRPPKAI